MTEAEWLMCDDLRRMVSHIQPEASDRKLRLLAVAFYGRLEPFFSRGSVEEQAVFRTAVSVSDRYADGDASPQELAEAFAGIAALFGTYEGRNMLRDIASDRKDRIADMVVELWRNWELVNHFLIPENPLDEAQERLHELQLVRDIIGNPFRPVTPDPAWLTSTVVSLAQGIYADRAFDRMPILADALQDAGCDSDDILAHCRDPKQVHVRGWREWRSMRGSTTRCGPSGCPTAATRRPDCRLS
jgi:hypothetical protein